MPRTLFLLIRSAFVLGFLCIFSLGNAFAQDYTVSGYVTVGGSGLPGVTMNGLPGPPVTDATGFYSALVTAGFTGDVTPSLTGYTFSPLLRSYTSVAEDWPDQNYTATLNTYTISGTVTDGVSPLSGVVISGLPGSPTTNASGIYTATVDYGFTGTAIPVLAGYSFSPENRPYSGITTNQTDQDYTGTLGSYTISGTVTVSGGGALSGVTMSGLPGAPVTDGSGNYSDTVPYGWTGTVTPVRTGYTFTPSSTTYPAVTSNQDTDYTATLSTFTISGTVTDGVSPLSGVVITGLPGSPTTNASGIYTATVDYGFTGTAIPVLAGYSFSPENRPYSGITTNQTDQDYTGTLGSYTISGTVTVGGGGALSGVTMSGLPGAPVTDGSGNYSDTVPYGWTGTVTPVRTGYTFTPSSTTYPAVTSNQDTDYTATLSTFTISGTVTDGVSPLASVVINGLPGPPTTDAAGFYSTTVNYGFSGTATPARAGYAFSPSSRTYTNVIANQADQNYTGTYKEFITDKDLVTVPEGGTASFTVKLSYAPESPLTVSVTRISGDSDITVTSGSTLNFNSSNWNTPQTVQLSAAEDPNAQNGESTIRVSATGIPDKDLTARELDNDTLNFDLDLDTVTVPEGGTAAFNVRLTADPAGTVNVAVARISGDTSITVQSGSSLVFNSGNWSVYQPVTLAAAEDSDAADGSATIRVSDDAADISPRDVSAEEEDNDNLNFAATPVIVTVPEGSTATFQVTLTADPLGTVTATVARTSGDSDITVSSSPTLTLNSSNWSSGLTVTLAAAEDSDVVNGTATIRVSDNASVIPSINVTANETDNDEVNFITNTSTVIVPEGSTASFFVRLSYQPAANVTATISRVSGDTDISVQSGSSLLFTPSDWDQNKEVVLQAAADPDVDDGTATIRIAASGIPNKDLIATEQDNAILNGEIRLVFSSQEGTSGSTVDVFVEIFNNKLSVSSFEFRFIYNDAFFEFKDSDPGTLTSNWSTLTTTELSPGTLRIQGATGGGTVIPASSSGSVIKIILQVKCLDYTQDTNTQLQINNYLDGFIEYSPEPYTALFTYKPCADLGDVNNNGSITPSDAQKAFEIYLGRVTPDFCQRTTADVNCNRTTTPLDALQIFEHYLGRRVLPVCCAEASTTSASLYFDNTRFGDEREKFPQRGTPVKRVLYPLDAIGLAGDIVSIPVIAVNPIGIQSFGFELAYPTELLQYLGTQQTRLTDEFDFVTGTEEVKGLIRVEGESQIPTGMNDTGSLAVLTFRVIEGGDARLPLTILTSYGDLLTARLKAGHFVRLAEDFPDTRFIGFGDIARLPDGTVRVPVEVSTAFKITSFGLALKYAEENLTFLGVERTGLTQDFIALDGDETNPGIIRVGGFGMCEIQEIKPGSLCNLIFAVTAGGGEIELIKLWDGLRRGIIQKGKIWIR